MAGIGLYGVYYSKATVNSSTGVLSGYNGVQTMGKAISASFEPTTIDDNPLYANNGIAERDLSAASGGTLDLTLDRLKEAAYADLFGLTQKATTVLTDVGGTGFEFSGEELSNPVGVAFVRWIQEDNSRSHYDAVVYAYCVFSPPSDDCQTLGEQVEWQTPEISGTVYGKTLCGTRPWKQIYRFPSQAAAEAFITNFFASSP